MSKIGLWRKPVVLFSMMAAVAAMLTFSLSAYAHGSSAPKHGGVTQVVGEIVMELVTAPDGIALYVEDDGEAIAAADFTAKAILTTDKGKTEVPLTSAAGNKFEGKGVKVAPGNKVILMIVNKASKAQTGANITVK